MNIAKENTEYKKNFEGVDKGNIFAASKPTNYARYSKEVFETRTKSNFSQHGANILSNNSQWGPSK